MRETAMNPELPIELCRAFVLLGAFLLALLGGGGAFLSYIAFDLPF